MTNISLYDESIYEVIEEIERMLQQSTDNADIQVISEQEAQNNKSSQPMQLKRDISKSSYLDTVNMLINFLDYKDEFTKGHCERVARLAMAIGRALDLSDIDLLNLEFAALLHDIGKLIVPDNIINKEGKLTLHEYEIVKMHPIVGYTLIKDIAFLDVSKRILLQHHERVDGKGYPMGLDDDQLDVKAKILSVADAYDAMTGIRPYRKEGLSMKQAIHQLETCKGSQFDGNIVDVFISLLKSGEAA